MNWKRPLRVGTSIILNQFGGSTDPTWITAAA